MSRLTVKADYKSALSVYDTQTAIGALRKTFEENLADSLNLKRVSAPLIVEKSTDRKSVV